MLRKYSVALLFMLAATHNAYAVVDPILLVGNVAQYIEQFKEGINTLEEIYRRMEEAGIVEMVEDAGKLGENMKGVIGDVNGIGKNFQPGAIGGSFMGKEDSLPPLPTQPYKPEGLKNEVAQAAQKGFAGKKEVEDWVKKEIYTTDRTKDKDNPTEPEALEEKRILLNSMANSTAVDSYSYAVMVQTRLDSMSNEEEQAALKAVSDGKNEQEKLKALENLQKRIVARLNEINKLQAKLDELAAVKTMTPTTGSEEKEE